MPRPTKNQEIGRDRILADASNEFRSKGYAATTMQEVARAAGVTKAALYYHFDDKDDLFLTVLESQARGLQDAIGAAVSGGASLHDVLRGVVAAYVDPSRANILALLQDASRHLPRERVRDILTADLAPLGPLIPYLDRHRDDLRVPTSAAVIVLLSAVAGRALLTAVDPSYDWSLDNEAENELVDILLHGISRADRPPPAE